MRKTGVLVAMGIATLFISSAADASLVVNQQYYGSYGLSTGGCGTSAASCSFTSIIPTGSTIVSAYLYTSLNNNIAATPTGTLNGSTVSYATALGINGFGLQAYRANVTALVTSAYASSLTPNLGFTVTEGDSTSQDGEALAIIYANALLPSQTVAILDGFSATTGDTTTINFSNPLNPGAAGFVADLRLADGFSYDGAGCTLSTQTSTIKVNGVTASTVAGCNDDSIDATPANGNLITVGGDTDPFTPANPTTAQDHERYNLAPYIASGDRSIGINTNNPSGDDNIFMAALVVSGVAAVNAPAPPTSPVPEPGTWALMLAGFGLLGGAMRRRRSSTTGGVYA